jgi:hypothetical protein
MRQKLKNSYTPTITSNAKENADTLYNGYNTARKQPEPL